MPDGEETAVDLEAEAEAEAQRLRLLRREVIVRFARLRNGRPIFCQPSRAELAGVEPRKQGPRTDGKPIYDSREVAESAARELEKLGAVPLRAYRCARSKNDHHHLTRDNVRTQRARLGQEKWEQRRRIVGATEGAI